MEKKNFLQQVSFAFKYGKDKAREEFAKNDEKSEMEELKKKRKRALAMFESDEDDKEDDT